MGPDSKSQKQIHHQFLILIREQQQVFANEIKNVAVAFFHQKNMQHQSENFLPVLPRNRVRVLEGSILAGASMFANVSAQQQLMLAGAAKHEFKSRF